jgi:hypothetical protein
VCPRSARRCKGEGKGRRGSDAGCAGGGCLSRARPGVQDPRRRQLMRTRVATATTACQKRPALAFEDFARVLPSSFSAERELESARRSGYCHFYLRNFAPIFCMKICNWNRHYYAVQSPYQMGTFAPCPFSLSQLVDSRKALVWRNLSVSERCTFFFPTSRFIRPSISRKIKYEKQVARTNMSQSGTF